MIALEEVKFKIGQAKVKSNTEGYAICLVYIDVRTVDRELDLLHKGWGFEWELIDTTKNAVKGKLITKDCTHEDVGYPNEFGGSGQPLKDAVSDARKRCAVQLGIGSFLYEAPFLYTTEVEIYNSKVKKLTKVGEKLIQGKVNEWYKKLNGEEKIDKKLDKDFDKKLGY